MPVWAPSDHVNHACSQGQLDLDGVMHDEPQLAFQLHSTQRVVDDLRALKPTAAMDKGIG